MKILAESTLIPGAEIEQTAERLLRESPYFFLKNLSCRFEAGVVTLRGRVPYGQLKQFAESIVCRIDGVREVINRVEVFDPAHGQLTARAARNAG
jgi:osmotically-inducible protein OsmY